MSIERRIIQENRRARNLLYSAVALGLVAAALWLAFAWLFGDVVNRVYLGGQTLGQVTTLLGVMLGLVVVRAGIMWAGEIVAQHSANTVKSDLRGRLAAKLFQLGPLYTRGERAGELVHITTSGVEALDEYISQYQPARLLAGLVPALVFLVILVLDFWTLPILLFTGPILLLLLALIGGRTRELTELRFVEMSWMSAHFLDMLRGLETLKLFGRSKEQSVTIETISRQYGNTTMDVLRTAFQTSLVLEWGATAATALVAIQVSVRLMSGVLPFDTALVVLLLTPEFFLPLRQLAVKYHAGTAGKAAAERIYAILDQPPLVVSQERGGIEKGHPLPARMDIVFDDVGGVAFDDRAHPALDGFSLRVLQGQTVALVGPTGAGKTTVANLLLRFVEPAQGKVTVGGIPLGEIPADEWRTQLAYVPQHPYLFEGTVSENLALAKPDATADEIVAAARAANAHEFIQKLPHGYATQLGERGARLSGGQIQRLAIARALLKDAPLLILDEPTSHLDAQSQELIRDALRRLAKSRTILLIAHRLTMVYDADVIVVVEKGRVVEVGPAHALREHGTRYGALAAAYERGAA